jgi:uncharacterized protein (TIGR04255 family)
MWLFLQVFGVLDCVILIILKFQAKVSGWKIILSSVLTSDKTCQDFGTFSLGIQIPYEESRDILNLQLASLPRHNSLSDNATIILSLDYFLLKTGEVALEEAFKWLDVAHQRIEDAFEACITQKLRHLFKEVKE